MVNRGSHLSGQVQPQSLGDGRTRSLIIAWPQSKPPGNTARLICCSRAAFVGGWPCIWRPLRVNRSWIVSLMQMNVLVRSYRRMVNRSNLFTVSSDTRSGVLLISVKVRVRPWWVSHVFHAVFLLNMESEETVLQPVKAWNIGSASDLCGPSDVAISSAAMYRKWSQVPKRARSHTHPITVLL